MTGEPSKNRLLVGKIGSAHGIKGGVRIAAFTENPLSIAAYGPLETSRPGLLITITDARLMKETVIAKLKGITDRTAAEGLNGVELYLDRERLPVVVEEDDFYHVDLLGLQARLEDGTTIGEVIAMPNFGAGDLIEIRNPTNGDTFLYPFTKEAVPEIHVAEGFLVIRVPTDAELEDEEPD